jgi:hypothetical protein
LVCVFRHPLEAERDRHIVSILGAVGDAGTVDLLNRYLEDPELGRVAVSAVRKLRDSAR